MSDFKLYPFIVTSTRTVVMKAQFWATDYEKAEDKCREFDLDWHVVSDEENIEAEEVYSDE